MSGDELHVAFNISNPAYRYIPILPLPWGALLGEYTAEVRSSHRVALIQLSGIYNQERY